MNYQDRITPTWINMPEQDHIMVVGSNLAGRSGKGMAKTAVDKWKAKNGVAEGMTGMCYMIPMKDGRRKEDPKVKRTLTLDEIKPFVDRFIEFASLNDQFVFEVPLIGCGLAGYQPHQIAPLFKAGILVDNIRFPEEFWKILLPMAA